MTVTSIYVSRVSLSCLLPYQEALRDQQVGLIQASIKLLSFPGSQSIWDFVCAFKNGVSCFLQPSGSPECQLH